DRLHFRLREARGAAQTLRRLVGGVAISATEGGRPEQRDEMHGDRGHTDPEPPQAHGNERSGTQGPDSTRETWESATGRLDDFHPRGVDEVRRIAAVLARRGAERPRTRCGGCGWRRFDGLYVAWRVAACEWQGGKGRRDARLCLRGLQTWRLARS